MDLRWIREVVEQLHEKYILMEGEYLLSVEEFYCNKHLYY